MLRESEPRGLRAPAAAEVERYDLLSARDLADPYPLYAALRERGRIHWSGSLGGWALTRYSDVHEGLREPTLSAARFEPHLARLAAESVPEDDPEYRLISGLLRWFTFADPPPHTRLRTLSRRTMSALMKAMAPYCEQLVGELLDTVASAREMDVIRDLGRPLSVGVIVQLLGVPMADRWRFVTWAEALTSFIGGALNIPDRRQLAQVALDELSEYLAEMVRIRRRAGGDDLLAAMVHGSHAGDRFSDKEVIATTAMLLFAGHGTTTNLIGNGMLALGRDRPALEWLAVHPAACDVAIEEFLRYDASVQITVRIARRAGALGFPEIAVGDRVFLFVGAANRDPDRFGDPEALILERGDKGHLSFGYGMHFCLGAPLARIEAPIAFRQLLTRFSEITVDTSDLHWQPTVGFRGLRELPLSFRKG